MTSIFGSVGLGGINRSGDVRTVQELLNRRTSRLGLPPLRVDGAIGGKTADAIRRFQNMVMGLLMPDGRVDPGGRTIQALTHGMAGASPSPSVLVAGKAGNASPARMKPSQAGIDLIHSFETCRLEAYPDPGSVNGEPWTIGWGSTGPDIKKGTRWTQEQADARFKQDLERFSTKVEAAIGKATTTQSQFDAMVSLSYNIGSGAFEGSSVLRHHKAGAYAKAADAFLLWVKNDGKVMKGLQRRRAAEAALYNKR